MAKLYTSPAFFFRLQLLLFLITNEFNLMFCWAQFTFSIAFVQKFTPGLSDLLPNFPNLSLVFLLTALLLVWKEQLVAQALPKQDKDYLQLKKTPHLIIAQATVSKPRAIQDPHGIFWVTLDHSGTSSPLQVGTPTTPCTAISSSTANALRGQSDQGTAFVEGGHTVSLLLPWTLCTSAQWK